MQKAILLLAYGAGNSKARFALSHFEALCRLRFSAWPVRWAYTSCIVRERMALQRQKSDSVSKALMRLHLEKFSAVAVQPLQTIAGWEHENACASIDNIQAKTGMRCAVGLPLLDKVENLPRVASALLCNLPPDRQPCENVIFMGHGARHVAGAMYAQLGQILTQLDAFAHIGTMSGTCALEHILPQLMPGPVWLLPLLSTIGQHAVRDMAGPGPNSWRSLIEAAGHECRPVLTGMAEATLLCEIWLDHLADAIAKLSV